MKKGRAHFVASSRRAGAGRFRASNHPGPDSSNSSGRETKSQLRVSLNQPKEYNPTLSFSEIQYRCQLQIGFSGSKPLLSRLLLLTAASPNNDDTTTEQSLDGKNTSPVSSRV